MMRGGHRSVAVRLAMLAALALGAGGHARLAAAPVVLDGVIFSDELGGFTITGGRGRGTLEDPFVIDEDIHAFGPAILTIHGIRARFGNRIAGGRGIGFVLVKNVRNMSGRDWPMFEIELREGLMRSSPYEDGLSFEQRHAGQRVYASDRFAEIEVHDEPLDAVVFSQGLVRQGETVSVRIGITDYSPNVRFYLLQRRNAPMSNATGEIGRAVQ